MRNALSDEPGAGRGRQEALMSSDHVYRKGCILQIRILHARRQDRSTADALRSSIPSIWNRTCAVEVFPNDTELLTTILV